MDELSDWVIICQILSIHIQSSFSKKSEPHKPFPGLGPGRGKGLGNGCGRGRGRGLGTGPGGLGRGRVFSNKGKKYSQV